MTSGARFRQRGAALVFAVMISMVLSAIAFFLIYKTRQDVELAAGLIERFKLDMKVQDTLNSIIYGYASIDFKMLEIPGKAPIRLIPDGHVFELEAGVRVSVQDIAARLHLMPIHVREWTPVLNECGLQGAGADALIDKLRDWIDKDSLRSLQGAEAPYYFTAGLPGLPRNAYFQVPDELLFIPGFDESLYTCLLPYLSLWGTTDRAPLWAEPSIMGAYADSETITNVLIQRAERQDVRNLYATLRSANPSIVNGLGSQIFRINMVAQSPNAARSVLSVEVNMRGGQLRPFYYSVWK